MSIAYVYIVYKCMYLCIYSIHSNIYSVYICTTLMIALDYIYKYTSLTLHSTVHTIDNRDSERILPREPGHPGLLLPSRQARLQGQRPPVPDDLHFQDPQASAAQEVLLTPESAAGGTAEGERQEATQQSATE